MMKREDFWRYATGGVLSVDGRVQVNRFDRTRYIYRVEGMIALVDCEHFTVEDQAKVSLFLSKGVLFTDAQGQRLGSDAEVAALRDAFAVALPMMDTVAIFE